MSQPAAPLLRVENLRTWFHTRDGVARAVDGVTFDVFPGETVSVVGESGSGKSVTALSLLRLIDPPGRIESGSRIEFEGRDLMTASEEAVRRVRGNRMAMVFQEPMTALNPVFTVGDQVAEVARIHDKASRKAAWDRAVEMLSLVGIPSPAERAKQYPHEMSGGMRQRVLIAMALVMNPALLIADEPTTALDVTIQAQILELLASIQQRFGTAIILITHDLGVVAEAASRVLVMYGGQIVERANVRDLFARPQHPYTQGLLRAMPRVGMARDRLLTIPGTVPAPTSWPSGCRFRDRCALAFDRCVQEMPALAPAPRPEVNAGPPHPGHLARCHIAGTPLPRVPRSHERARATSLGSKPHRALPRALGAFQPRDECRTRGGWRDLRRPRR